MTLPRYCVNLPPSFQYRKGTTWGVDGGRRRGTETRNQVIEEKPWETRVPRSSRGEDCEDRGRVGERS